MGKPLPNCKIHIGIITAHGARVCCYSILCCESIAKVFKIKLLNTYAVVRSNKNINGMIVGGVRLT